MVNWIELHKDFCLVIAAFCAALLSPFAAVVVAFVSAKRQARALLEATGMQVRAGAVREYRQRNIEKLREELAAEIFYVSQLRMGQQKLGLDHAEVVGMAEDAQARKIRIHLLVGSAAEQWKHCFELEEQLIKRIRGTVPRKVWSDEENAAFDRQMDLLGVENLKVLEIELQAVVGME